MGPFAWTESTQMRHMTCKWINSFHCWHGPGSNCLAVSFWETNSGTDSCIIQYENNFSQRANTHLFFRIWKLSSLVKQCFCISLETKCYASFKSQACISKFLKTCSNDEEDSMKTKTKLRPRRKPEGGHKENERQIETHTHTLSHIIYSVVFP